MENQNIQWETWNEQPQENNTQPQEEQPQINWGEQSQQEQPQENINTWGEQPQHNQNFPQSDSSDISFPETDTNQPQGYLEEFPNYDDVESENYIKTTSYLGEISKINVGIKVWKLNHDVQQIQNELLKSPPKLIGNDGRYILDPTSNTELANVLISIRKAGESQGLNLQHCFLQKNQPQESHLNIVKFTPNFHFIYFINASYNSGEVILNLSSINGPVVKAIDASSNLLIMIPGWVPYSISKNVSNENMIAITGTLT